MKKFTEPEIKINMFNSEQVLQASSVSLPKANVMGEKLTVDFQATSAWTNNN